MSSPLALFGGPPAVPEHPSYEWPIVNDGLIAYVSKTLATRPLNYGADSMSRDFETAFAKFLGVDYAIGTCSGTIALTAAYYGSISNAGPVNLIGRAKPTGDVIVGAYGFWATATSMLCLGLRPVFCDVDPVTGNIDPAAFLAAITPRTVAVAVTHIDGHPADMAALCAIASSHGLAIIEDCSHAHGSTYRGRLVGTFGDAAAFSMQTRKMLSGGEGGVVATNNAHTFYRMANLINIRRLDGTEISPAPEDALTGMGLKLRISPLAAALGSYHLEALGIHTAIRTRYMDYIAHRIQECIPELVPPSTSKGVTRGAYYEFPIRYPLELQKEVSRPLFLKALAAEGVELWPSNTRAFYSMPIFGESCRPLGEFPVADRIDAEAFYLPTFTEFEDWPIVSRYADALIKVMSCRQDLLGVANAN